MKSIRNIYKIVKGEKYISISIKDAIKYQEKGLRLYQVDNGKSIYIKYSDFEAVKI